MDEIITYGGGELLVDIFNGIVRIVGTSEYSTAIRIALLLGLFFTIFKSAFEGTVANNTKYFILFLALYNGLLLAKTDIKITDKLNPNLAAATVNDVPYGLALLANITSQIGEKLVELSEVNYSIPNDLQYHKSGMIKGNKLLRGSTNFRVTNSELAGNLKNFTQQCIFYDLMLNKYTLDDLKNNDDLWSFVKGQASPARSFTYTQNGSPSIVTCQVGAGLIDTRWGDEISQSTKLFGMKYFPNSQNPTIAASTLMTMLPLSYDTLLDVSKNASEIIRQNMMINMLHDSVEDYTSNTGATAAAQAYAEARAEMQLKNSSNITARQAEKWVPLLKIVFECIFYGAFPFVFLLMILPKGILILKNYFTTFLWLQSWGMLYAILHRVMMHSAEVSAKSASLLPNGSTGLTFATQAGVNSVGNDIGSVAGYMTMSIPFISMGLVKGINSMGSLATSFLAVPQSAATQAANETTSGNISLGNANLDNQSYNNTNANKQNEDFLKTEGRITMRQSDGSVTTAQADGSTTFDHGDMYHKYGTSMNVSGGISSSLENRASEYYNPGVSQRTAANESKSQAYSDALQSMAGQTLTRGGSLSMSDNLTTNQREAFSNVEGMAVKFGESHGLTKDESMRVFAGASVGLGIKGILGANGGVDFAKNKITQEAYNEAKELSKSQGFQETMEEVASASVNSGYKFTDSQGNSINKQISANMNEAKSLEEQSSSYFDAANGLNKSAANIRNDSVSFNQNEIRNFHDWAKDQTRYDNPNETYGDKGISELMKGGTDAKQRESQRLISEYQEHRAEGMLSKYESELGISKESMSNDYNNNSNYLSNDQNIDMFSENVADRVDIKTSENDNFLQKHSMDKGAIINEVLDSIDNTSSDLDKLKIDNSLKDKVQKKTEDNS
jgi:conjugal transfer mating pair stabilization protein TraG